VTTRIGRAIFVALLAVAIATLPASLGFAAGATMASDVAAMQAMPDCDHHQHNAPSGQPQKPAHDAACLAACALNFGFTATDVSGIAYSAPESAALKPMRASTALSSLMGSPPFRPPRA
jgi:glutamate mutase epsilon subunit